jgi:hypothetical protein
MSVAGGVAGGVVYRLLLKNATGDAKQEQTLPFVLSDGAGACFHEESALCGMAMRLM